MTPTQTLFAGLTFLCLMTVGLSANPSYSLTGKFSMFFNVPGMGYQPNNQYQLYFTGPNVHKYDLWMVNLTTNAITSLQKEYEASCSQWNLAMNSQGTFYCFDTGYGRINQVDPLNKFKIINHYQYPLDFGSFTQMGDYIVIGGNTSDTKDTRFFSMITNSWVFKKEADLLLLGVFPTQTSAFYVKRDVLSSTAFQVIQENYSNGATTTFLKFTTPNTSFPVLVQMYNRSTVGVIGLLNDDNTYSIFTFANNTVGSVITNTSTNDLDGVVYPVNDTHFVIVNSDPSGTFSLNMYYINTALKAVLAGSLTFPNEFAAVPYLGTNQIVVTPDGEFFVRIDLKTFSIIEFFPYAIYPFQLGNGSWVEISYLGYTIYDSTHKTLLYYKIIQFTDIKVETQYGNMIYALYFGPSDGHGHWPGYLFTIEKNTSTFKIITLPVCPCGNSPASIILHDVTQDASGNLGVVFRVTNQFYFIVYNSKIYGPYQFDVATGNQFILSFPQYQKGILYLLDTNGATVGPVTLISANITTGQLLRQKSVSLAGTVSKINNDLAIYTNTDLKLTTYVNIHSISEDKDLSKIALSVKQTTAIAPVFLNNQTGFVTRHTNGTVHLCNDKGDCSWVSDKILTNTHIDSLGGNQSSISYDDRLFYGYYYAYAVTALGEQEDDIDFIQV